MEFVNTISTESEIFSFSLWVEFCRTQNVYTEDSLNVEDLGQHCQYTIMGYGLDLSI